MTTTLTVTNIIDGKAVNGSASETRQILNPSTGEVLTEINESTVEDGDRAVAAARAALSEWKALTPGARSELLHTLVTVIEDNIDELARLETLDAGKPTTVARGEELPGIAGALRPRTCWSGARDHPVELSPLAGGVEGRSRIGGG
jgi:betaine-aldehyde dehydrogenase